MEGRGTRRRSTSLGEGDILNSTTDVPPISSTDRFPNFNPDSCVSTPQINVIGSTDDSYRSNTGTQMESRIRTRSRGIPNSIDTRLRDDYSQLKTAVYQWGEMVCSSAHTVDVIEREHNALCVQIEHKISEVLLKRGDYNLVGELGSLKDRLSAIRKEAKQLAQTRDQHDHVHRNKRPVHERLGESACTEVSKGSYNTEDVFMDNPLPTDPRYNIRQRDDLNLSRIDPRGHSRNTDSVMARGQEPTRVSSPALLSDPQALNVSETPGRRGMDVSQPLTVLQANLPELNRDSMISNPIKPWMNIMKTRQDRYEEQLASLQAYMVSISMTIESTKASHQKLLQAVNHLEDNYSEVFQRME